ncbi:MAG TPA: TRAP transporter large permease subunit [Kiritimatiellia bacterium]|nr:TRAP transporter large permease subunit [Kiritimatiellia bacterium]
MKATPTPAPAAYPSPALTARGVPFKTGFLEDGVIAATLLAMAVLPVVEFLSRKLLGGGLPGAIDYLRHGTLLLGFVAAVAATREDRNLKIAALEPLLPENWRIRARGLAAYLTLMVCTALTWAGVLLVMAEAPAAPDALRNALPAAWADFFDERLLFTDGGTHKVGGVIPVWMAEALMPLGLLGIMIRLIQREAGTWTKRLLLVSGPLLVAVLAAFIEQPSGWFVTVAITLLIVGAALGTPIFALLGGAAALLFWKDGVTIAAIPAETYRIVTSEIFPAIPIFTLIGFILSESGASRRLENLFAAWFGWMPGGIAVAVTLLCAFFTTFTGASGATILALGGLLLPILIHRGFSQPFSIGLLTSTGSIGLLLPPSLVVILYAVVAQVPIVLMFKAAIVPGMIIILPVAAWCVYQAARAGIQRVPFDRAQALRTLREAGGELSIPVVVLGLIVAGWCTPVEAAAFGAIYALGLESLVHRDLGIRAIYSLLVQGGIMVGGILIVLGLAMGLTSYLIDAGIPLQAAAWVEENVETRWMFLLALNIALIAVGCFMDIYSALIIIVPLILPMGAVFGIDPAHLGVIFLANLQLGYLTPPVGMNLFLASFRFQRPLLQVARAALPFLLLNALAVLLITYIPALSLWAVK